MPARERRMASLTSRTASSWPTTLRWRMSSRWRSFSRSRVQKLREELEAANAQLEKAQREYDLEKAAQLQYGAIPELNKQLEEQEALAARSKEDNLLRDKVTEE